MSPSDLDLPAGESHYIAIRRSGRLAPLRLLDERIAAGPTIRTYVGWHHVGGSATTAGRSLALFDREVRRAAQLVAMPSVRQLPRPVAVTRGTLELVEANAGSLDLLLIPIGVVDAVMQAHPLQVLAAADVLLNHTARIRTWLKSRNDPLRGVSARQALEVLKAFGSDGAAEGSPEVEMTLPGGEQVRANKITMYRENLDGTWSITVIE